MLKSLNVLKSFYVLVLGLWIAVDSSLISKLKAMDDEESVAEDSSGTKKRKRHSTDKGSDTTKKQKRNSSKLSPDEKELLLKITKSYVDAKEKTFSSNNEEKTPGETSYKSGLQDLLFKDSTETFQIILDEFIKAEQQGHGKAAYCLAVFYALGWGDQSKKRARTMQEIHQLLTKAKNNGSKSAEKLEHFFLQMPSYLSSVGDISEGEHRQAIQNLFNNRDHKYRDGLMFAFGLDVPQDFPAASECLAEASEEDKQDAHFIHALVLLDKRKSPESIEKALQFLDARKSQALDIIQDYFHIVQQVEYKKELLLLENIKAKFHTRLGNSSSKDSSLKEEVTPSNNAGQSESESKTFLTNPPEQDANTSVQGAADQQARNSSETQGKPDSKKSSSVKTQQQLSFPPTTLSPPARVTLKTQSPQETTEPEKKKLPLRIPPRNSGAQKNPPTT